MAVPDTPNSLCSRCVSVEWQTVSKAADRSRPISTKSAVRRKPVRKLRYIGRHRGRRGCRQGSASELSRFARSKCGNCVMSGGIVVTDDVWSSACLPVRTFQGSVMSSHHPVSGWATFCIPLLPCKRTAQVPELIPSLSLSSVVSDHFHTFILLPLPVHLYSSHVFFSFSRPCVCIELPMPTFCCFKPHVHY